MQQLRAHPDVYAPFVESDWDAYLRDMARPGTWGDHLTLQVRRLLAAVLLAPYLPRTGVRSRKPSKSPALACSYPCGAGRGACSAT